MKSPSFIRKFRDKISFVRNLRKVNLAGVEVCVLPYDRAFWDSVDIGKWEPETLGKLREIIQPGTKYCDIGAWIGPTVLYARHLGADVTCFEPDPLAFERLLGNLRMNGALDVNALPFAIGSEDSRRKMGAMVGSLGKSATSLLGAQSGQTIEVFSLKWETCLKILGVNRFDVIKMDIEGGEAEVLPTFLDYLRNYQPKFLLSTHWSFLNNEQHDSLLGSINSLKTIYSNVYALEGEKSELINSENPRVFLNHSSFFFDN